MTFNEFANQQVINSNNETGTLIHIDEEHVIVKYFDIEKTYNTQIVFLKKFLRFVNEELNTKMDEYVNKKDSAEQEKKESFKNNNKASIVRQKRVTEMYKKIALKNRIMKSLFGSDFVYPPYEEFMKKYKNQINEEKLFNLKLYSYRYWEYM